jgi:hypothetical protein
VMTYKNINSRVCEIAYENAYLEAEFCSDTGYIKEWNCESIHADPNRCGISGSPTRVKKIENVVLTPGKIQPVANTEVEITQMFQELVDAHILD